MAYRKKWDDVRQQLDIAIADAHTLASTEVLRHLYGLAADALNGYANGFIAVYDLIRTGTIKEPAEANRAFGRYKQEVYRLFDAADASRS